MRWWVDGRGACQFITYGPTRAATDVGAVSDEEQYSKIRSFREGIFRGKRGIGAVFFSREARTPPLRAGTPPQRAGVSAACLRFF